MKKVSNLSGIKFGKLKVLSYVGIKRRNSLWNCACECGRSVDVFGYNLKNGHTVSCGCARASALRKSATKHGMYGQRFYNIWRQIIRRCSEPKHKAFKNYGGRGIKNKWESFVEFKRDMYSEYLAHVDEFGEKDTTIDRINVNGNYCKENCRWATWSIQANNRRI